MTLGFNRSFILSTRLTLENQDLVRELRVQKEAAELVLSGALPVEELVSHRFPLDDIHEGIERALHPSAESLKIIVQPQR